MNMMRDGLRMMCTGIEMLNGRVKLLDLDGWSAQVCNDLSKYDPALSKLYRKYWRRSYSSSPEMEVAMGLIGSLGMYHFKRKISNNMFTGGGSGLNMPFANMGNVPNTPQNNGRVSPQSDTSEDIPP